MDVVQALVGLALLIGSTVGSPVSVATAYPPHPPAWLVIASPDGAGALLHAAPWGDTAADWPDGAVMGVLGEPVFEGGAAWVRVQDPLVVEGWMVVDRLASLPEAVVSTPPYPEAGPVGGVRPRQTARGTCPDGFPVMGKLYGRGGRIRLADAPGDRAYRSDADWPFTCFRTLREAAAWGFSHRAAGATTAAP